MARRKTQRASLTDPRRALLREMNVDGTLDRITGEPASALLEGYQTAAGVTLRAGNELKIPNRYVMPRVRLFRP